MDRNCKNCKSRSGYWCLRHKRSISPKGKPCADFKEETKGEYVKVIYND